MLHVRHRHREGTEISVSALTPSVVRSHLATQCRYAQRLLKEDYRFGANGDPDGRVVPLAAFAHEPADIRSACIAVTTAEGDAEETVASCRGMGAPVVFVCQGDRLQWWAQRTGGPERLEDVPANLLNGFFDRHRQEFSPQAIYRAKTTARLEGSQLAFVDLGLMPAVENELGDRLSKLVERVFARLREHLGWRALTPDRGHWLLRSSFWLLAAKILKDKDVLGFKTLNFSQPREVFTRVGRHYYSTQPPEEHLDQGQLAALSSAAPLVAQFAALGHVTTESLAQVYDTAFITKKERKAWGIHTTPPFLVDYMLWRLRPWIEEIPQAERYVFEPGCGHGAFLIGAMRLLRELAPAYSAAARQEYLRRRLRGLDQDAFAIEVARLSLTLADIPNPNGWRLDIGDMFASGVLERRAKEAMIVLANPPFEAFSPAERARYAPSASKILNLKAVEAFRRALMNLRPGAVFGIVCPQGFLHSDNARQLREWMLRNLELQEVAMFADKMFTYADVESAILLGRRPLRQLPSAVTVRFRRVREADVGLFQSSYRPTTEQFVPQERFLSQEGHALRLPEIEDVWAFLGSHPLLNSLAHIGQGFQHKGRDLPPNAPTVSVHRFPGAIQGFAGLRNDPMLHQLPDRVWLNLEHRVIRTPGTGLVVGTPQALLNYAPVGRGPWRLKGLLDRKGHPVTSRFLTVRARDASTSLEYLWGLINSPLANAYAYCHSEKRDILAGTMRKLPVPRASVTEIQRVSEAVRAYFAEVSPADEGLKAQTRPDRAKELLLAVEAEVLRLYGLPPRLERQVLDLFAGHPRPGVPFDFDGYYPAGFTPFVPLHVYVSESYRLSTAGEVHRRTKNVRPSKELLAALDAAVEAFSVDD